MRVLGISTVTKGNKVTLVRDVPKILNVEVGDNIAFYEENGKVFIKKE